MVSRFQPNSRIRDMAHADFRPSKVLQNGNRLAQIRRNFSDDTNFFFMAMACSVREVQSGHTHAV